MSIYDYLVDYTKEATSPVSLDGFEKKVVIIVNVASQWLLAKENYIKLKKITETYENATVWAFPCNQFGGQEPNTSDEVRKYVEEEFEVNFPIFDKILVNGPNAHPLYKFLKSRVKRQSFWANFFSDSIKWNFTKFVCVNGVPLKRFEPLESFSSIEELIEKYQ